MATKVREVERKYEVDAAFRLPDLAGLPGVVAVGGPHEQELSATYYDSPDLRLASHRVTMRRRTGGTDAGWHLKQPASDGEREEVRLPLGRATRTPPQALRAPVEVYLRGAPLAPVVKLATRRTVHTLRGLDDAVLAEVADDHVTATNLAGSDGATVTSWREVEVELVEGDRPLLEAAGKLLRQAGATPSSSSSKLARALAAAGRASGPDEQAAEADQAAAEPGQAQATAPAEAPTEARPPADSAAAVVLAHLSEQVAALHAWDPRVREDEPDAVHRMRVTTRRLRSTLATFRPLFDNSVTEPIRAELKWLGSVLGAARDSEVTGQRLLDAVHAEPEELVLGPVAARMRTTMDTRHREAVTAVRQNLSGKRYFDLLDALDALLATPPLTKVAEEKADRVLRRRTRSAWRRTRRAAKAVPGDAADPRRDVALHEVRKAAKRARYAGEVAQPVVGKKAKRFAGAMKSVQKLLGEHQDTVVSRVELRQMGARAHLAGENGFTFGLLHGRQQAAAERAEDAYQAVWKAAAAKRHRRWMSR